MYCHSWNEGQGPWPEGMHRELVERGGELPAVGQLASHEECQRVLHAWIVGELLEVFVDDFGAGLRGEVVAQVHRLIAVGIDQGACAPT